MVAANILICEDESIVAKDLQNRLKKMGYIVSGVVSTGEEAIKKAAELPLDLVLMDIRIKGKLDGIDAAKSIHDRFDIPVIYITAYADEKTLQRAKISHPFGYILKPFKEKELHAMIEISISKSKTEKRLKEREKWLVTVLQSIGDAVIATDLNMTVTFINPVAESITGWEQEEAIGQNATNLFKVIDEKTGNIIENPLISAFERNIRIRIQEPLLLITKTGGRVPIKDSATPIKDDRGNITGAVWVFRDITLEKQAQKALRESEARTRRLVESNIIGVMIADFSGNLIEANDAFLQLGGYTRDDFLNRQVRWTDMTPEDYRALDENAIDRVKNSGTCTPYEKEFIRSDGSRVSVLVGIALLEGSADRFVAFVLDISDRKRLEKALRQQTEKLTEANQMKDEFLGIVSHEIRTPLNAMLGWSQLLNNRKISEATLKKGLETIERNAKAQVKIIDDILDASRIIRGKIRVNPSAVDLVPIINATISDLRPTAELKHIQIDFQRDRAILCPVS